MVAIPNSTRSPQRQQYPRPSACDTRLAFLIAEIIGMPTEVAVMLCPQEESTPVIRRARARIIRRAYQNQTNLNRRGKNAI